MNKKPFVSIFELLNANLEKIKKEENYTGQRLNPYEHKACVVYEGSIYALSDNGRDMKEVGFIETKDSKEVGYASRTKFFYKETEVQYFPTIKEAEEFILATHKAKESYLKNSYEIQKDGDVDKLFLLEDNIISKLQEASKENHTHFWEMVIANKDRLIIHISPHDTYVSIKDTLTKIYIPFLGYDYGILPLLRAVGIEYTLLDYSNEKK